MVREWDGVKSYSGEVGIVILASQLGETFYQGMQESLKISTGRQVDTKTKDYYRNILENPFSPQNSGMYD